MDRAREIHEAGMAHLRLSLRDKGLQRETSVTWDFRERRPAKQGLAQSLALQAKQHRQRVHDTVPGSDGDDGA